jgi:hypothetical protein
MMYWQAVEEAPMRSRPAPGMESEARGGFGLIERAEDPPRLMGHLQARAGEGHGAPLPHEQGGAKRLLEPGDLVADRRLGQKQSFRGPGKA